MSSSNEGLQTTELIQTMIKSFAKNDGIENFGFILATYELDKNTDDYQVEVMMNTFSQDITIELVNGMTIAFNEFMDKYEEEEDDDDIFDDFNYN